MKKMAVIFVAIISFLLVGCVNIDFTNYKYDDGDTYEVGNMEYGEEVNELDISFISGDVEIRIHDENTITITETVNNDDTDYAVRSKVEAGTLKVKFYKSGLSQSTSNLKKNLVIYVPNKVLSEIEIDVVSADVKCNAKAIEYSIDSVSGEIELSIYSGTNRLKVDTVSGDIDIKLSEDFGFKLEFDTVSGDLNSSVVDNKNAVHIDSSRKFQIDTVSGDLTINIIEKL